MRPTQCLRDDHELIAQVIRCFETALLEAREKRRIEAAVFEPFLEFFADYADSLHYEKEERCLFACMRRCGIRDADDGIQRLIDEHKQSRQRVNLMLSYLDDAAGGKHFAIEKFHESAQKFRDLIIGHIPLENGHVFRVGDEQLPREEHSRLEAAYREMDEVPENAEARRRCVRIGRALVARWTPRSDALAQRVAEVRSE